MKPTFLTVIQVFQIEGMVALGKMLNPGTNQITKSIEHARYVIDVLDVLHQKTKGNLDPSEASFLDQTLSTLKLNFVDEFGDPNAPFTAGELA